MMKFSPKILIGGLGLVAPLALAVVHAPAAQAGIITFTDQAAFLNAIAPGFYLETFDSFIPNSAPPSPQNFSNGTFSYTAQTAFGGQFFVGNVDGSPALSVNLFGDSLIFNGFNPSITAIGGNFFVANQGTVGAGTVTATVLGGETAELSANISSAMNFFGFVSDDGTPFMSLNVSSDPNFVYADNLIVSQQGDQAVPEPLTMLGASAAIAFGAAFKRRRA